MYIELWHELLRAITLALTLYHICIYRHEVPWADLPILPDAWHLILCLNFVYISAVLSPLRKLAKITAENVNQPHRYKVGHKVLLFHRCVSNMDFLVLFLWFWFIFL